MSGKSVTRINVFYHSVLWKTKGSGKTLLIVTKIGSRLYYRLSRASRGRTEKYSTSYCKYQSFSAMLLSSSFCFFFSYYKCFSCLRNWMLLNFCHRIVKDRPGWTPFPMLHRARQVIACFGQFVIVLQLNATRVKRWTVVSFNFPPLEQVHVLFRRA